MAGENSAIWRCTTTSALEANQSTDNVIAMNETPVIATGGYVMLSDINWRISVPENERIDGQVNEVQDMGLDGIDYIITTTFKNTDSTSSSHQLAKLRDWISTDQTQNDLFPKGNIGLRLDDMPMFNVLPSSTYGLVIAGIHPIRDPVRGGNVAGCAITLRFSGAIAGVGT